MRIVAPIPLVRKNSPKTNFFCVVILQPLQAKVFKSETISFPFFLQDSENLTSLDIGLKEVGAKICLNRVNK